MSKEFEGNEVKEYASRSGQSQKKLEEIMLQLNKGQNDIKTRRKDEINKIKSRGFSSWTTLTMQAASCSGRSVTIYRKTWRHIQENVYIQNSKYLYSTRFVDLN